MMKLTKYWVLSILILFFIFSMAVSVSADEVNEVSSYESDASITFTPGEDAPPVVDPDDPSMPYDPDPNDPTEPHDPPTGDTGPLTLDYVSSVHFGEQMIEADTQIYESATLRPFIQVTDRRGTGEGWNVTAQASYFTSGEEVSLPGALLTFSGGEAVSTSTSDAPRPHDPVTLYTGGDAANVVTAGEDQGLGSWITRWFPAEEAAYNDNVTLEVPAGAATTGEHAAVITWTLTSGPGQ
jgi:hypothetical protein